MFPRTRQAPRIFIQNHQAEQSGIHSPPNFPFPTESGRKPAVFPAFCRSAAIISDTCVPVKEKMYAAAGSVHFSVFRIYVEYFTVMPVIFPVSSRTSVAVALPTVVNEVSCFRSVER